MVMNAAVRMLIIVRELLSCQMGRYRTPELPMNEWQEGERFYGGMDTAAHPADISPVCLGLEGESTVRRSAAV